MENDLMGAVGSTMSERGDDRRPQTQSETGSGNRRMGKLAEKRYPHAFGVDVLVDQQGHRPTGAESAQHLARCPAATATDCHRAKTLPKIDDRRSQHRIFELSGQGQEPQTMAQIGR